MTENDLGKDSTEAQAVKLDGLVKTLVWVGYPDGRYASGIRPNHIYAEG
jgi:hypothetical protein